MFEFRVEWEDGSGVASPVFRQTWARLEFRRNGQPMTRFWSESTRSLRDGVYVSVFPLASWIVDNWWLLLGEGLRYPSAIDQGARRYDLLRDKAWLQRHNLLSCRHGMAYPDLTLFREDDHLAMTWFADPNTTTTNGRFMDSGSTRVTIPDAEAALENLVLSVIERIEGIDDEDANELREAWSAIRASQSEERDLCNRLAILGLDPYGAGINSELETQLEQIDLAPAIVRDLLAAAKNSTVVADLISAKSFVAKLPTATPPTLVTIRPTLQTTAIAPYRAGYDRAAALREFVGISNKEPVQDLAELAGRVFSDFKAVWVHGKMCGVDAAVQVNGMPAITARERQETSKRFLLARALHHWLYVTTPSVPQRLLTRSGDWQQAASRAFAAELLAPANMLRAQLAGGADWEHQEDIAAELDVSPMVIAHQIENHGLG